MFIAIFFIFNVAPVWFFVLFLIDLILGIILIKEIKARPAITAAITTHEIPDDLPPAMLSYLYKKRTENSDLEGEIIELIRRNYIALKDVEKENPAFVLLNKNYQTDISLYTYQKKIIEILFPHSGSNISSKYVNIISDKEAVSFKELDASRVFAFNSKYILEELGNDLVKGGYRKSNKKYGGLDINYNLLVGGLVVVYFLYHSLTVILDGGEDFWIFKIGIGVLAFMLLFIYSQLYRYVSNSHSRYAEVAGFRNYIKSVEKDKVGFELKQGKLGELVPYLVTFKVFNFWTSPEGLVKLIVKRFPRWSQRIEGRRR